MGQDETLGTTFGSLFERNRNWNSGREGYKEMTQSQTSGRGFLCDMLISSCDMQIFRGMSQKVS